jgi:hypothetical protein
LARLRFKKAVAGELGSAHHVPDSLFVEVHLSHKSDVTLKKWSVLG